jgi:hypothetical protein
MAGLAILKHTYDLSDEVLCERRVENPYYQFFCCEEFFQHRLVFDRSSLTRWRNRMGEERLKAFLEARIAPQVRRRARHRPSQSRAPHGPQLSRVPPRRRQQCRRRLQLPPPDLLAQVLVAPNPQRSPRRTGEQSSLKSGFFTGD